jgi:hypothetical protein
MRRVDKSPALGSSAGMNPLLRQSLFALIWMAGPQALAGDVFRWQDRNGVAHFGDRPPEGVAAGKVVLPAFPAALQAATPPMPAPASATPASPTPVIDLRPACDRARWALAALQTQRPVYRDGNGIYRVKRPPRQPDGYAGPRTYLSDAERSAEITRQQAARETACAAYPELQDPALAEQDLIRAEHCEAALAHWQDLTRENARAGDDERERALGDIKADCEAR